MNDEQIIDQEGIVSGETPDEEKCPECLENLMVKTYTNDAGQLKMIAECPKCGFISTD